MKADVKTKFIQPCELQRGSVIIERSHHGVARPYPVREAVRGACSAPEAVHVMVAGGAVWCYDGCSPVEVLA